MFADGEDAATTAAIAIGKSCPRYRDGIVHSDVAEQTSPSKIGAADDLKPTEPLAAAVPCL
jgi:hypothetical protein